MLAQNKEKNIFPDTFLITNLNCWQCSRCLRIAEWRKPDRWRVGRQERRLLSKSKENIFSSFPKRYKFPRFFSPALQVFLKFHFPYFLFFLLYHFVIPIRRLHNDRPYKNLDSQYLNLDSPIRENDKIEQKLVPELDSKDSSPLLFLLCKTRPVF